MSGLGRINIIIGENNSGKTSVLEAIQLLDSGDVLANAINIARRREAQLGASIMKDRLLPFDMLLYSFPMQEKEKEIYIQAESDRYGECRVGIRGKIERGWILEEDCSPEERRRYESCCDADGTIRMMDGEYTCRCGETHGEEFYFDEVQRMPQTKGRDTHAAGARMPFSSRNHKIQYVSPFDIYTGRILSASLYKGMLAEERRRLTELLRMFDERIIGVETGIQYGRPATLIEMEDCGLVPVSAFGDGLKKILTLASAVVKMRGGILLIDEFETGIHKHALIQVAKWMAAATERYDVQVFLTTHSGDAIDALVEAQGYFENINAYRLEHYKSSIYVKRFQGEEIHWLKADQGMDIL